MSKVVHIIDYGAGNLYSVARAVEKVGGIPRLTNDSSEITEADRIILPGVGAFPDGMRGLVNAKVDKAIVDISKQGKPLLGICLGMQMLATKSEEFGLHEGLGLIPGHVEAIPNLTARGILRKVPFIGWAELSPLSQESFKHTPLSSMKPRDAVYLVHSYHFVPENPSDLLAVYDYHGIAVTAAISRKNIFGCQFHPEKSGSVGLDIIRNFLDF